VTAGSPQKSRKIASHVIAIDIDGKLLETSRVRLAESGLTNCSFVEGDAYEIASLAPEPVDHVFLANVFHGVPDKTRLASAVRDVLKPGGLFAIVNWHARPREETTVLGEPRGPATALRIDPEKYEGCRREIWPCIGSVGGDSAVPLRERL
jgi:ubiquinone/menaquinone biosynthesis C-methylase UbiE